MSDGHFFVGDPPHQMYVEYRLARQKRFLHPLVLIHGGFNTGTAYGTTPDGRPGWAALFPDMGFDTYVVDLPGHGRSGDPPDFARLSLLTYVERTVQLLRKLDGAVAMGHSMGGGVLWKAAEALYQQGESRLLKAAIGLAPSPTANMRKRAAPPRPEDRPMYPNKAGSLEFLSRQSQRFPRSCFDEYFKSTVPESARAVNEVMDAHGTETTAVCSPHILDGVPALVLCGDEEKEHLIDREKTAAFLGIPAYRLGRDWGLPGHGHMLIMEFGNEEIARRLAEWLIANVKGP
ncbi:MAG: alpha/beta fold hydrolase [Chloroflexi bacterium]|nr:alpha/beta fold hydrolase [Chloroflexota bacterium]